jgi:O-antigen/teichoic acid export membrane protein
MSLAFIPLYVNYLGTDAMGLVGLFALLQAWLVVADLVIRSALWDSSPESRHIIVRACHVRDQNGLTGINYGPDPLLLSNLLPEDGRVEAPTELSSASELSRLSDGANDAQAIRTRLHKLEQIGFAVALMVALGIWVASTRLASVWCATDWLMKGHIPVEALAQAFTVMGVVFAMQLIESLYAGSLLAILPGEQRLARPTTLIGLMATVRGLGAVAALVWFSPTINVFFIWQGAISLTTVALFAIVAYRALPPTPKPTRPTSLKKNVAANYLGQGWGALMALAFVPLYIRFLGIESYGLIGIFAILQAWLSMLDLGMRPALGREMARFTGGAHDAQSIRNLLRSVEVIGFATASLVALGIWAASGWLASDWLTAKNLPVEVVTQAFAVMGVVTALQFIQNIYVSSIAGLQRQVLQNAVTGIMATARGLGAVAVLVWVSPTIKAFFIWQGVISLLTLILLAGVVYHALPSAPYPARFSKTALLGVWRFAAGTVAITFLALLLTQTDKILLSRLLPLAEFAHYALAGVVANALYVLVGPISAAFYPRFTELATCGNELALRAVYHQGAQLVTVLMGSAAVVLMLFGDRVLLLWTADPALTRQVAPLMAVMAMGTLCNGLMWMPYQMQLAHGWTSLAINTNIIAVSILVPAILWVVPHYGAIGAAWIWVTLNASYLVFSIYFFHRRLLPTEKWRWYRQDVFIPLVTAAAAAALCLWAMPEHLGRLGELGVILISSGSVLAATALVAPLVRRQLAMYVPGRIKLIIARMERQTS